jgi:hypothetical protein
MKHLSNLHSLCEVLGIDFKQTVYEVHPGGPLPSGLGHTSQDGACANAEWAATWVAGWLIAAS